MRPSDQEILDHAALMLPAGRPLIKAEEPSGEPPRPSEQQRRRQVLKALLQQARAIAKAVPSYPPGTGYNVGRLVPHAVTTTFRKVLGRLIPVAGHIENYHMAGVTPPPKKIPFKSPDKNPATPKSAGKGHIAIVIENAGVNKENRETILHQRRQNVIDGIQALLDGRESVLPNLVRHIRLGWIGINKAQAEHIRDHRYEQWIARRENREPKRGTAEHKRWQARWDETWAKALREVADVLVDGSVTNDNDAAHRLRLTMPPAEPGGFQAVIAPFWNIIDPEEQAATDAAKNPPNAWVVTSYWMSYERKCDTENALKDTDYQPDIELPYGQGLERATMFPVEIWSATIDHLREVEAARKAPGEKK